MGGGKTVGSSDGPATSRCGSFSISSNLQDGKTEIKTKETQDQDQATKRLEIVSKEMALLCERLKKVESELSHQPKSGCKGGIHETEHSEGVSDTCNVTGSTIAKEDAERLKNKEKRPVHRPVNQPQRIWDDVVGKTEGQMAQSFAIRLLAFICVVLTGVLCYYSQIELAYVLLICLILGHLFVFVMADRVPPAASPYLKKWARRGNGMADRVPPAASSYLKKWARRGNGDRYSELRESPPPNNE